MTPQQEHWKRMWHQAQANMPMKIIKKRAIFRLNTVSGNLVYSHYERNVFTTVGKAAALARCLGMKMLDPQGRYAATQHIYTNMERGSRPKDKEVRRKLELCAGPYGKLLAWQKLKELGLAEKYQKP